MTVRFIGGPADGRDDLQFGRAPAYLRVVTTPTLLDPSAGLDVLDQLDDTPEPGESVSVYRQTDYRFLGHACGRGGCVDLFDATYRHMERVDGEALRETEAWRAWAESRPALTTETTEDHQAAERARAHPDHARREVAALVAKAWPEDGRPSPEVER